MKIFNYNKKSPLSLHLKWSGRTAKSLAVGLLSALALTACSNDNIDERQKEEPKTPSVYLRFHTKMAEGTRSETNSSGESEDGRLNAEVNESLINALNIIICEADVDDPTQDTYLYQVFGHPKINDNVSSGAQVTIEITDTDKFLAALAKKKIRLYLVANEAIAQDGITPATAKFTYTSAINKAPLGVFENGGRVLPLVNAKESGVLNFSAMTADDIKKLFFASTENTLNVSNDIANVGSVGTIQLERAVARIDFQGQPEDEYVTDIEDEFSTSPNVPTISTRAENEIDKESNIYALQNTEVYLRIDRMQLFNVSKEAYMFKHTIKGDYTSANYDDNRSASLFGIENGYSDTSYNWVVDTDWTNGNGKGTDYYCPFEFDYTKNDTSVELAKVLGLGAGETGNVSSTESKYHPVWYVSENTLPHTSMMPELDEAGEVNAANYATGICFRMCVLNKEHQNLGKTADDKKGRQIEYNTEDADHPFITITMPSGEYQEIPYDEEQNGYYLTYYALIHHNIPKNWKKADGYGPMNTGVVRNNVYQLKVASISHLPNPKEAKPCYLELEVTVKPWQKRENVMDF